jgi:hypothetical protein
MDATVLDQPARAADAAEPPRPVWKLDRLTPGRCRVILAAVLLYGFVSHLSYLRNDCPIDLSGDEAHYWDWSRQLDLSYYSKGPLVAYLIRASCHLFGDTMWAVRLPALVLAVGTGLVTYLLALKLFKSDRIALGAVLLNGVVPLFVAGSLLMTIDPPFFFCWALATYLAALAIFDGRKWVWPAIGVAVGLGFLAKYAMFLWMPILLAALWADRPSRRWLRTPWPWVMVAVALLFTIPVIVWNARHGWVSLWHVSHQTGTDRGGRFNPLNVLELIGGQIGILGPGIAAVLIGGAVYALARRYAGVPFRREMRFLALIGLPFFALIVLTSFRTKIQMNWPAPAYFTLMILAAYFLATRLQSPAAWRPWRWWFYGAVVFGVLMLPVVHDTEMLYPLLSRDDKGTVDADGEGSSKRSQSTARQFDFSARLKGWAEQGRRLSEPLRGLGPGAFVLCHDYQTTGEMAFYLDNQPKTYCAGSYFSEGRQKRYTQYDLWPDRALDPLEWAKHPEQAPDLLGRNALYVGWINDDVRNAFERVEGPFQFDIVRRGVTVRTVRYVRCFGFKGMRRPGGLGSF